MIDANTLLSDVGSSRGAPMGRRNIEDNPKATVTLFRMRMVDDCYDVGGAYWGMGNPMYAAVGEGFEFYQRAESLAAAKTELLNSYPDLNIKMTEVNDDFLAGYIEVALAFTNDESDESGGDPIDQNYSADDISPELMKKMVEDCQNFLHQCGHLITDENCLYKGCSAMSYAGHDFWLTRCGHGCGFWDGDWAEPAATTLTEVSQGEDFGECWLEVGDDGKIY